MDQSERYAILEKVQKTRDRFGGLFPVPFVADSTGGRTQLQPLRAKPWLKNLLVIASFPFFGVVILIAYFNLGALLTGLFTISILWVFAIIRTMPDAPLEVEIQLDCRANLRIESDSDKLSLRDVGPIWEQDGLLFALVHDFDNENASSGKDGFGLLPQLHQRAAKLGEGHWNPDNLQSAHKALFPGIGQDLDDLDNNLKSMFSELFAESPSIGSAKPILLGRPKDRDSKEFKEKYDRLIGTFNTLAFVEFQERQLLGKDGDE